MAKNEVAELDETENKLPSLITEPPSEIAEMLEEHVGKGLSQAAEDNLVPLIYVLQGLSPQVQKRNPAYIEGAEPGCFWLRNAPEPIVPGDTGLLVQSCFWHKDLVEWRPRDSGGGFIGRHAVMPDDAERFEDTKNKNRVRYIRPNGNEVIETRNHVVRVHTRNGAMPFIFPFSSTGHTTSRSWMQLMNSFISPKSNKPYFSGSRLYRLTTQEKTNPLGTWFAVMVKDEGWVKTKADLDAAVQLEKAFASGTKQGETPMSPGASGEEGAPPF